VCGTAIACKQPLSAMIVSLMLALTLCYMRKNLLQLDALLNKTVAVKVLIWSRGDSSPSRSSLVSPSPFSMQGVSVLCCTLGTISSSNLDYATLSFWISKESLLPCHNWSTQIIAIWISAAQVRLNNHNPTQNVARLIKIPRSFRKKLNDSVFTKNPRSITTAPNLTVLTNNNLRLEVSDWRPWAYTYGGSLT